MNRRYQGFGLDEQGNVRPFTRGEIIVLCFWASVAIVPNLVVLVALLVGWWF